MIMAMFRTTAKAATSHLLTTDKSIAKGTLTCISGVNIQVPNLCLMYEWWLLTLQLTTLARSSPPYVYSFLIAISDVGSHCRTQTFTVSSSVTTTTVPHAVCVELLHIYLHLRDKMTFIYCSQSIYWTGKKTYWPKPVPTGHVQEDRLVYTDTE